MNPAVLYFSTGTQLRTGLNYLDTFQLNGSYDNGLSDFLNHPSVTIDLVYTTPEWYIGAYSDYCLTKSGFGDGDGVFSFNAARLNAVKAGIALGVGSFSLGADIIASKTSYLNNRKIRLDDDPVSVGSDFLQKIFLAEFNPTDEEAMKAGIGIMMNTGIFTIGAYSDKVLDFITERSSGVSFDVARIMQSLDLGISLNTNDSMGTGILRFVHILLAADLKDIGDDNRRMLNLGMEGSFLFSNRMSLDFRLGYNQPLPDLNSVLSLGGNENGVYSVGVGSDLLFMRLNAAVILPCQVVESLFNNSADTFPESVAGVVSFSLSL